MSNRISRLKDSSDIVFKKAPHSIDVFVVIKGSEIFNGAKYVTKEKVSFTLKYRSNKVVVFDEDLSTVLAVNFLDNV